ncbi:MAG: pirin family protein [Kiloniellales bacterium]|nr:pirin family protein [Kiloniellales bacterium]
MADPIITVVAPRPRDLGGFEVRRILPSARQRSVGPFVFLDHMGPAVLGPGRGIDVRPHPHIGLATVTYLFDGELLHRDSLGCVQQIRPGDVNWMTAGRGIVHSERSSPEARAKEIILHGIQSWVALPRAEEESEPSFHHHPIADLPQFERDGVALRLIAGSAYGETSPVRSFSPMFYLDAAMPDGTALALPAEYEERAIYVAEGKVEAAGRTFGVGRLPVFAPGADVALRATAASRLMLLGGAALDVERSIWWNFVSSRPGRIEQAKVAWTEGRFAAVPGESEFIPLPEA